ncbi:MAG TPA: hypothetical protein VMT29_02450 [Steroidobacteraceae bacterium]|nr:hypothetical protein [Steroidobacteraceae bacterium]
MSYPGRLLVTLALLAPACGTVFAGDPKPAEPADIELLEFLGSVDTGADSQAAADDGSWIDYLAQTDIGKVAKTADPNGIPRAKQVATGTPPPASGDKKDD